MKRGLFNPSASQCADWGVDYFLHDLTRDEAAALVGAHYGPGTVARVLAAYDEQAARG